MALKIVFLGTPEFGAIILEGLVKSNQKPLLVITLPDKPVGRKQIITPPPVKVISQKYNLSLIQPSKILEAKLDLERIKPDLIIAAAYGQVVPKEILKIPKYGCLNLHPSLLPQYRGASPIQAAILNADKETGVTIILMDEKMDHGPIISTRKFSIANRKLTTDKLTRELAELSIELLLETIPKWIQDDIQPKAQNDSKATYTKILKKEDGKINWSKPAKEIEREIRAFYPWPGSFSFFERDDRILRVKILEADVLESDDVNQLCIKCGKNYLVIKKIQPEGKKAMSAEEFLRGYHGFNPLF